MDSQNRIEKYAVDYDLYNRQGIHEIDKTTKDNWEKSKKPFFDLIFNKNKLDTVIIHNLYEEFPKVIFKVMQNDSISFFKNPHDPTVYGEKMQGYIQISYYVFTNKEAKIYRFTLDEKMFGNVINCDITEINRNSSSSGLKFLRQTDTVNFENKLLTDREIPIYKSLHNTICSTKFDRKFTFLSWFKYEGCKAIY